MGWSEGLHRQNKNCVVQPFPLVSVIIPSHNSWETLRTSFPAFLQQSCPTNTFEVIVVERGNTDRTWKIFTEMSLPSNFHLIPQPDQGKAAARNTGIRASKGEFLLFIDANIIPTPDLVQSHIRTLSNFPDAFVQGKILPHAATSIYDLLGFDLLERFTGMEYLSLPGNLSIRKKHIQSAGLFNETFEFNNFEGFELGLRLVECLGFRHHFTEEALGYRVNKIDLPASLRRSYDSGKALVGFLRMHSKIFDGKFSFKSQAIFSKLIRHCLSFSPVTFNHAQILYAHLSQFEKLCSQSSQKIFHDALASFYRQASFYCFFEGAYTALNNLKREKPLLLQKSFQPQESLTRLYLDLQGGRSCFFSPLCEVFKKNGFEVTLSQKQSHVPLIRTQTKKQPYSEPMSYFISYFGLESKGQGSVKQLKKCVHLCKEVWVPTSFAKQKLQEAEITIPIQVLAPGASTHPFPSPLSCPPPETRSNFTFLGFAGRESNWTLLMEAFLLEFKASERCLLWLHSKTPRDKSFLREKYKSLVARSNCKRARILITCSPLTVDEQKNLLWHCHAYVHLNRNELYPHMLLEAMLRKKTIVSVNSGGQSDWLSPQNAYLYPESLSSSRTTEVNALRNLLQAVFRNPEERKKKIEQAEQDIQQLSVQRCAEKMVDRLFLILLERPFCGSIRAPSDQ